MMDVFHCKLCTILMYLDGRLPKVLHCGHTICSFCVFYLVSEGNLCCPYCKEYQHVVNAESVPYNDMAIAIITSLPARNLSECLNHRAEAVLSLADQAEHPRPLPNILAGYCDEHGLPSDYYCIRCRVWICEDCTIFNHSHPTCSMSAMRYCSEQLMMMEGADAAALFDENIMLYALKKTFVKKLTKILRNHIMEVRILIGECHKAVRALDQERFYIISTLSDAKSATVLLKEAWEKLGQDWGADILLATCRTVIELKNILRHWYGTVPVENSQMTMYAEELQRATGATLTIFKAFIECFKSGTFTFDPNDKSNKSVVRRYLPSLKSLVVFKEDSDDEYDVGLEVMGEEGDDVDPAASKADPAESKEKWIL
ncbi:uncharacterized protein [Palaemon carinicauda]|uniref:uncharacterized protein n=1 Tax=Palaemon carinicauda TaxID=392227 RepID=UPI0035B5E5AE